MCRMEDILIDRSGYSQTIRWWCSCYCSCHDVYLFDPLGCSLASSPSSNTSWHLCVCACERKHLSLRSMTYCAQESSPTECWHHLTESALYCQRVICVLKLGLPLFAASISHCPAATLLLHTITTRLFLLTWPVAPSFFILFYFLAMAATSLPFVDWLIAVLCRSTI